MVMATTPQTDLTPEQRQRLQEIDMLLNQIDSYLAYLRLSQGDEPRPERTPAE